MQAAGRLQAAQQPQHRECCIPMSLLHSKLCMALPVSAQRCTKALSVVGARRTIPAHMVIVSPLTVCTLGSAAVMCCSVLTSCDSLTRTCRTLPSASGTAAASQAAARKQLDRLVNLSAKATELSLTAGWQRQSDSATPRLALAASAFAVSGALPCCDQIRTAHGFTGAPNQQAICTHPRGSEFHHCHLTLQLTLHLTSGRPSPRQAMGAH